MNLARALVYFAREACLNLLRSWRVSLLAVVTIAVSLVLGGTFLLASRNLAGSVERWRGQMRVVLYLKAGVSEAAAAHLAAVAGAAPWVASVERIPAEEARRRFREAFPSLSDLMDGGGEPLPASLEVALRRDQAEAHGLDPWLEELRRRPEVAMVDDDRDWLGQVETAVAVVRLAGLVLGGILLGAAIFTIASIIRLTAYLHHEEIAIMRLVGATEFFIRGPFYMEGLVQGLLGGGLAGAGLYAGYRILVARSHSLLVTMLAGRFLTLSQLGLLLVLGAAAGLIGAIASLRRESL